MLNLEVLNIFLTVADLGSFSEAGRQLHISQPAVSQAIQGLEKQLAVQLFLRQGRSVHLSEAGQLLRPMAQELVASSRRIEETISSLQGEVVGELNIGCTTASGKYLLPGLIARFRRLFSRVHINVLVTSRDSLVNKLRNGDVALGVMSKKVENHDFEYQDFYQDDVILIAPANHPWAKYRQVFPDDLLDEPMILREEAAGTREVVADGLRQHDITPEMLNIAMVLGNAEAIEMAVEEELGIAFISRLAAARGLALGRVVEIKVEGMELYRNLYLVRNHRQPFSRSQMEFWDFVKNTRSEIVNFGALKI